MKIRLFVVLLLFLGHETFAQKSRTYAEVDKKILSLPVMDTYRVEGIVNFINQNFEGENERIRAIYVWIADNVTYDVPNMLAVDYANRRKERITNTLKYGRAICQGYAELFDTLCNRCGIHSCVVEGYTRQAKVIDYLPHAWVAANIDGKWYLFDPTWGAGYVNDNVFARKFNEDYFMVSPEKMIKTHMPFDPMKQFLAHTLSNTNFLHYDFNEVNKDVFNFNDTIAQYEKQDEIARMESVLRRMEKNGINNSILIARYNDLKRQVENEKQNQTVTLFNNAVNDYNLGIKFFNDYINYKNHRFTPAQTDQEIQKMIVDAGEKLSQADSKLKQINNPGNIEENMMTIAKSIVDLKSKVKDENAFLEKYFKAGKVKRKTMFYKVTYFGVPVN